MTDFNPNNINVQELEGFIKAVLDAGLNFEKQSDADLFQVAFDEHPDLPLPQILANAASKKAGIELLDDYNASHPLGQTHEPTSRQTDETPQANRSGFDILEAYNRNNPL